jgi:hypothetical protein
MAATRINEPIEMMTLGNMRANGVRSLDVTCWQCRHRAILSADPWSDDVPVPSFGPRMVLRHRRRRRAAELAGAAAAREPDRRTMAVSLKKMTRSAPRAPNAVRPRVRAERRATHYAGRETAPRGSGDKSHNASGSV